MDAPQSTHHALGTSGRLGRWPRRLLHVPSMISYEWKPSNFYGNYKEPRYIALSYTWGRWKLKDSEKPHIRALKVGGVTWEMPRVDSEEHFSNAEFHQAIRNATYLHSGVGAFTEDSKSCGKDGVGKVDFLWLDVACIDQRFSADALKEIGRQAIIFKGAQSVYIWLCRLTTAQLCHAFQQLEQLADRLEFAIFRMGSWQTTAISLLQTLLEDPWFTSLWTLQEAFLCPQAIFLSKSARVIPHSVRNSVVTTLRDLLLLCEALQSAAERLGIVRSQPHGWEIMSLLRRSGLSALLSGNPMTLYTISSFRQATHESDRIYGIMQVFDFKLGQSADDADPGYDFTLSELEIQFGKALTEHRALLSQLHIFVDAPKFGEAWRVNNTSTVPDLVKDIPCFKWKYMPEPTPLFEISTIQVDRVLWGFIIGKACKLVCLQQAWLMVDRVPFRHALENATPQNISLDLLPFASSKCPEYGRINIPRTARQHQLVAWLTQTFGERIFVILLGRCSSNDSFNYFAESCNIGLIVLEKSHGTKKHWQRLGICVWYLHQLQVGEMESSEKRFLEGDHDKWQPLAGLFG